MKTLYKILVAAGCSALAWTASAGVSQAATAQANTSAAVIMPVSITNSGPLNFGKFMSGPTGGTVVVTTANGQTVTGDLTTTAALGATATAATFTMSGESGYTYTITIPAQTELTGPVGSTPMTITATTNAVTTGGTYGTFTGANETLKLGATLAVGAAQASGTYTGTITVAVDYN